VSFSFGKFVDFLMGSLPYTATELRFMQRLRYSGGNYKEFAKILSEYPTSELKLIQIVKEKVESKIIEPISSTEIALSMIGFTAARNFLSSSLLQSSRNTLDYALASETEGKNEALSLDYFVGGFIFDIVSGPILDQADEKHHTQINSLILDIWQHGMSVSKLACQIATTLVPELGLEKDLVLDAIVHDIGKLYYIAEDPAVEVQMQKRSLLAESRWLTEREEFGIGHDTLGHMILKKLGFVPDTAWVCLFHHQPFLAKKAGPTVQTRASILWLADHYLRYVKSHRTTKLPDRIVKNWFLTMGLYLQNTKRQDFTKMLSSLRIE